MSFPLINPYQQFFDSSGSPLASGTIEFRDPTTNNLINSYPTADDADAQTNANANPLTLNASGAAASGLFLEDGVKYKVILKNAAGGTEATHDDVQSPFGDLGSTANGNGASKVAIEDSAGNFTATNVEAALAEIISDLASTSNGLGASTVGIEDSAGNLTAGTVEAAIAEIFSLKLTLVFGGTPQTLTGPGAVDITSAVTHVATTGADALTLADGSSGQRKVIVMITDGGAGTLTPTNLGNGTTITFDDVGDSADLIFTNGAWHFLGGTATLA